MSRSGVGVRAGHSLLGRQKGFEEYELIAPGNTHLHQFVFFKNVFEKDLSLFSSPVCLIVVG